MYFARLRDKRKFNREKGAYLTLRVSAFCHTYRGTVQKMDGVEVKGLPVKGLLSSGCTKFVKISTFLLRRVLDFFYLCCLQACFKRRLEDKSDLCNFHLRRGPNNRPVELIGNIDAYS